jgi:F-type H+-transporting ATPase subunit delta
MKTGNASGALLDPYVEALLSLAKSQNLIEEFGSQTKELLDTLNGSPELTEFLSSPVVKAADKKAVLQRVAGDSLHPFMLNFLMVLVDRNRLFCLSGICEQFQAAVRKMKGIVLAEVTSAVPLNEGQTAAIQDKVKAMTGASDVEIATTIDPSILGGVIIKVGSQLLDSSLRSQLRRIGMSISK